MDEQLKKTFMMQKFLFTKTPEKTAIALNALR